MKMCVKIFFTALITIFFCGCFGPVLQVGDPWVPVQNYQGVPVVSAPDSIYKEIRYNTFGFDWDENDGFLIPVRDNSLNNASWGSKLTDKNKLYSVVFTAARQRHYIQKPDTGILLKYLEASYREIPGSKIRRTALKTEQTNFKGIPAVRVYMENFEQGRDLHLREESYFFFDPLQPDTLIYEVSWSERGKKSDWKSPKAEAQGKRFFQCFKLLGGKR